MFSLEMQKTALEAAINRYAVDSPDQSTQNGAVVILPTGELLVGDCNRFPSGVAEDPERWERPQKYMFVTHAEHSAVLAAGRQGFLNIPGIALASPWAACDRCAVTIIESGIKTLIRIPYSGSDTHTRWDDGILVGDLMMRESGIDIIEYSGELDAVPLLRNGQKWQAGVSMTKGESN